MSKPAKLTKVQIQIMSQFSELKDKYHNGYEYIDRHILVHEGEVWFRNFGGRQDTLNALVRKGVLKEHTITITEGYEVATYYAEIAAPVLVEADDQAANKTTAEVKQTSEPTVVLSNQLPMKLTPTQIDLLKRLKSNPAGLHSSDFHKATGLALASRGLARAFAGGMAGSPSDFLNYDFRLKLKREGDQWLKQNVQPEPAPEQNVQPEPYRFKHLTEPGFTASIKSADERRAAMALDPTLRKATAADFRLGATLHDNHGAWLVAEHSHENIWNLKGPGGWKSVGSGSSSYYWVKLDDETTPSGPEKSQVVSISFNRLEGQPDQVGEIVFDSFSELDNHIRSAARTVPMTGSHRCKYIVIWEDNDVYAGTFGMRNKHIKGSDFIQKQIFDEALNPKRSDPEKSLAWIAARSFHDQAATTEDRLDGSEDVSDLALPGQEPAADDSIHIWEDAGIGVAPFFFRGYFTTPSRSLQSANPSAYDAAMASLPQGYPKGSCSICGTAITNHFMVMDANGKKLVAGSSCINKSGDKGLTTKAKLAKRRHDQLLQFEEAETRRQAALEQERLVNDGLTNYELEEKQRADAQEARLAALEPIIKELEPYADRVADGRGAFRDSVAESLVKGELPKGRGLTIMIEILAREQGRRGSKAYQDEEARLTTFFDEIQDMITAVTG